MTVMQNNAGVPCSPTEAIVGDLSNATERYKLARRIHTDIDEWCRTNFDDGHRTHLGASLINRECSRMLWYTFRWVQPSQFDGRMQRLFQRGHREEARFIEYLRGIGATVSETTPDGKQHRVSGCEGHFGGSMDALVTLPQLYGIPLMMINEFKTQGTGPKFNNLKKNGVKVEKEDHYTQMSIYGWKMGHKYGLYMAVNKNDDDLHIEVVELDWARAERMEQKAHRIIFSRTPPPKLSESIAHTTCVYCDYKQVCHQSKEYERNCRSCKHSEAIAGKEWGCHKYQNVIPGDFIPKGCDGWEPNR